MPETIEKELYKLANDPLLLQMERLEERIQALDYLSFVLEIVAARGQWGRWAAIGQEAQTLKEKLEGINGRLFQQTRTFIYENRQQPARIRAWFDQFTSYKAGENGRLHIGPDTLDHLWEGVLQINDYTKGSLLEPEPDMIHYEPTPARVILDLIDHITWQADDIFYDIGSGLGHVPILFHLLTGCSSKGIEREPTYCAFARQRANLLGISAIEFFEADARQANFSDGTIFFLFTPFVGNLLQTVCNRLRQVAQRRIILLGTYGPCTTQIAQQDWLESIYNPKNDGFGQSEQVSETVSVDFRLGIYRSLPC